MRFINKITILTAFIFVLSTPQSFCQDDVIASVNEQAITLKDVVKRSAVKEKRFKGKLTGDMLAKAVREVRLKTLNEIIVEFLLTEEFKQNAFPIPNRMIREAMDKLIARKGFKTVDEYEEKGNDVYALKEDAKLQIGMQTLLHENVKSGVSVGPKETFEYYNSNQEKFLVPKLYSVNMLFVSAKDKSPQEYGEIVAQCYEAAKSKDLELFSIAVKKYSSGPNAAGGGSLGYMPIARMQNQFASIIESMSVSEIKGPLIFPGGTYFLCLLGIKEPEQRQFSEVSKAIRNHLIQQKQNEAKSKYIKKLKEKHTVVIQK